MICGMPEGNEHDLDVIVVGAGFAGLNALHSLRQAGLRALVLDAADGVGGTWFWNRYPGARCDVPSLEYSFGFSDELQQEWEWTEVFPAQAELEEYFNHVADRFDLRRDIRLSTRVTAATYDEGKGTAARAAPPRRRRTAAAAVARSTPTTSRPRSAGRTRPSRPRAARRSASRDCGRRRERRGVPSRAVRRSPR